MPFVDFDLSERSGCPNRRGWITRNGIRVRKRCGRSTCPWCGRIMALQRTHAIAKAAQPGPAWFMRVHNLDEDWQDRRSNASRLTETMRSAARLDHADVPFAWAWSIHENRERERPGFHLHAIARADEDAMPYWVEAAQVLDPEPRYERVRDLNAASAYLMDPVIENPVDLPVEDSVDLPVDDPVDLPVDDPVDDPVDLPVDDPVDDPVDLPVEDPVIRQFLRANGGRLTHHSAGFFPGGLRSALDRERHEAFEAAVLEHVAPFLTSSDRPGTNDRPPPSTTTYLESLLNGPIPCA